MTSTRRLSLSPLSRFPRPRTAPGVLAWVVLVGLLLAACSALGDREGEGTPALGRSGESSQSGSEGGGGPHNAAEDLGSPDIGSDTAEGSGRTGVQTRAMIHSAQVSLVGDDLAGVRGELDDLLDRWGGHVSEEQTQNDEQGRTRSATLTVRVPADHFEDLMSSFADIATVTRATRQAEDVTTQVIDVESRVRTQETSLARLRSFLRQAKDVETMLRVETQIAEREAELESLLAQQAYLADQVDLATVQVRMHTPETEPEQEPDTVGFLAGLRLGAGLLQQLALGVATGVGALLPFVAVLALVGLPAGVWVRTRRRRTAG